MKKAVFLDRDGTINLDTGYVGMVEDFVFLPHAIRGLQLLGKAGFDLFIVTNQSGVGRGYFSMDDVNEVHGHMVQALKKKNVNFVEIYVSPDMPDEMSQTRKPSPYFINQAIEKYQLDPNSCWMIGDKVADCECGANAGIQTIQILGQYDRCDSANFFVKNLVEAAQIICK